ncbi:hypothetical protein PQX77_019952 [Marasmius sp. AFHP31]|nr:hypothetical protein PQX77_019952 [Marasmius sp. AFHP31]
METRLLAQDRDDATVDDIFAKVLDSTPRSLVAEDIFNILEDSEDESMVHQMECLATNNLMSPIKDLPVEILGHILELAVAQILGKNRQLLGIPVLTLILSLSQVCSHWRNRRSGEVIRSCGNISPELDAELVSLWLQRASPHPVVVSLTGYSAIDPIPLLPTLSQSDRIGALQLHASDCIFSPITEDFIKTISFPVLHTFHLTLGSSYYPNKDDMNDSIEDFSGPPISSSFDNILPLIEQLHAPQLSRLELSLNNKAPDIHRYGTQIHELDLAFDSFRWFVDAGDDVVAECFGIIQQCPQLTSLRLYVNCRNNIDGYEGHLVLGELRSLEVDFGDDFDRDDMMELFSGLTLPKLEVLDIYFPDFEDFDFDKEEMEAFKRRSGFPLRRLSLGICGFIPPEDLWDFVGNIQTLEELHVGREVEGFGFLAYLLPPDDTQHLPLPNLHTLPVLPCISSDDRTPIMDDIVERVVKSRWWTDPAQRSYRRWKKVRIARDVFGEPYVATEDDGKILSPEAQKRMAVIADEGLDLNFECGGFDFEPPSSFDGDDDDDFIE